MDRSAQMRERWASMSQAERNARIEFLTGLWDNPRARARLSDTMRSLWADYKSSGRYYELLEAIKESHGS